MIFNRKLGVFRRGGNGLGKGEDQRGRSALDWGVDNTTWKREGSSINFSGGGGFASAREGAAQKSNGAASRANFAPRAESVSEASREMDDMGLRKIGRSSRQTVAIGCKDQVVAVAGCWDKD